MLKRQIEPKEEAYYIASQWQLIWRKVKKHRLALLGGAILIIFYIFAGFCEFSAPYGSAKRFASHIFAPPQRIRFWDNGTFKLRPFVYGFKQEIDTGTFRKIYTVDRSKKYVIHFFMHGERYKFWGLFYTDIHLFGVREGSIFLFGTDRLGRDLFSRNLYAARISLSVGLVGIAISFFLGCLLGGISGYFGGAIDNIIQRVIEFFLCIPYLPLWMALSAVLPPRWSPVKVYFSITIILSIVGWCGLARVVRGKILELREEDFTVAARISGTAPLSIITRHMIPSLLSYLIVSATLAIPGMILGETSLSFLGLGMRAPAVSWGTLLGAAQNVRTVLLNPWLLIPVLFVIITVFAFNFLGDGLRDAADPYK